MPTSNRVQMLWLIMLAVFLGGCATSTERLDDLDRTLRNYKKTIRWADFDTAYSFRKWEEGSRSVPPESLKNVRVTRYEVGKSDLSSDKMSYIQMVRIFYYRLDSARERQLTDRQKWEYDEEKGHWYLTSEMPEF